MFSDIFRILKTRPTEIDAAVSAARAALGKNDRVLWYLRLWKVGFVVCNPGHFPGAFVDRIASEYARRAKITETEAKNLGWTVFHDHELLSTLQHYLSLSTDAIRKRTFGYESPERLLSEFRRAEKSWHGDVDESFADPAAREIMRFPNGLAWFDLGRAACDREARAMGHGGNAGRRDSGDTLLSLRRVMDDGDTPLHKPLLTFVLDEHGLLGEMKGKFNEKPGSEHYNEIVALLRSPIVHGIKGGGYKPENNFRVEDLDEDTRADLTDEKPELGGLYALYKKHTIHDPRVMSALEERLRTENLTPPMLRADAQGNFTLQVWGDLASFAEDNDDGIVTGMLHLLDGETEHFHVIESLSDDEIGHIVAALPRRHYVTLMRTLQVRALDHSDPHFRGALTLAAKRLHSSPYMSAMIEAANDAVDFGAHHSDVESRIDDYISVGWSYGHTYQWLETDGAEGKVSLKIRAEDLVSLLTATDEEHDDYLHALHEVREHGWGHVDAHATADARREQDLSAEYSYEAKDNLISDPYFAELLDKQLLDYGRAGAAFMRNAGI
jgi:hypothetical protein